MMKKMDVCGLAGPRAFLKQFNLYLCDNPLDLYTLSLSVFLSASIYFTTQFLRKHPQEFYKDYWRKMQTQPPSCDYFLGELQGGML